MTLLNLNDMPNDPIEAIQWLGGVKAAVEKELDNAYAENYFAARQQGRFQYALDLGIHGKKRALAYTRRWNNQLGRMIRWNDGLDRYSTRYDGG